MKRIKCKGLILAVAGCVIITGILVLGFHVSAAAVRTASAGSFAAHDSKVHFESADVTYLCRQINLLQGELDDSVFGELPDFGTVSASMGRLRNSLNSHGVIDYESGLVTADANDLFNLADGVNGLGNNYATMIYRALGSIGTYIDLNGNVSHETQTAGNPAYLSCEQLAEGIIQSQSVDHLVASPITPNNLTAGTAAWVNGRCVIGNGSDNEKSYQRGMEDGKAGNDNDMNLQYTCHEHLGNGETGWEDIHVFSQTDEPGGCFTQSYHEHDNCPSVIADMYLTTYHNYTDGCDWHSWADEIAWQHVCTVCQEMHRHKVAASSINTWGTDINPQECIYKHTHYTCADLPINRWKIGCGKTAGQVEAITVVIRKNEE